MQLALLLDNLLRLMEVLQHSKVEFSDKGVDSHRAEIPKQLVKY